MFQMSLVQLEDLQMLLQIIILGNSLISLALASTFREQMQLNRKVVQEESATEQALVLMQLECMEAILTLLLMVKR